MLTRSVVTSLLLISVLLLLVGSALAVPPSPEAREQFIREGTWEQKVANLMAFEASLPPDMYEKSRQAHLDRYRSELALSTDAVVTVRVVVLLVDFPDFHYDASSYSYPGGTLNCYVEADTAMFDSLLFSQRNIDPVSNLTGSMTEWYLENSYGSYFIQGDVFGWFTMPENYSYYVGNDDGRSRGSTLASHAVMAANDQGVDFSPYGDPFVPGVIIIHAGPGAEENTYGIWSHRSSMTPSRSYDGVYLSGYTMQPEESYYQASIVHIGVFCHEWGHVLGVPDWYDVSDTLRVSRGLGDWCVMARGSWNNDGRSPAHFNCWSKFLVGFGEMQWLTENFRNAPIPQAATSPLAYALRENPVDGGGGEFWFVENRQKVGFDEYIPGSGLLIYHLDPVGDQTNPDRYRLALEEADGRRDLAYNGSTGTASDPFPGTTDNLTFHGYTVPDSRTNDGEITEVSVLNISGSDSAMFADLNVFYAMPYLILDGDSLTTTDNAPGGNGDGFFEQGETVEMYLEVRNIMKLSYYPTMHLDVDNADIEILQNDLSMGFVLNRIISNVNLEPIVFRISDDFVSSIVHFTFTITSDSAISPHDRAFTNTFEFDLALGRTQILLVDDDNNRGNDYYFRGAMDRLGLPYEHWDKWLSGSPNYANLSQYPFVFWMTGDYYPPSIPGGTLTPDDITFMTQLLNAGGNLLLASPSAPVQLQTLDPGFMAEYLHATLTDSLRERWFLGDTDHVIGGGLSYTTRNGIYWDEFTPTLEPINGGQPAFTLTHWGSGDYGYCGITYDGLYRTAFLSFAVEFLAYDQEHIGYAPPDSLILNALRFFVRGAATGVEDYLADGLMPTGFALDQNYPNPFNPSTTISYWISAGLEHVNLSIFNVLGRKVATLVDKVQGPGSYTVTWQGRGSGGARVASGVYFYRLTQGEMSDTKKMVLLK